MNLATMTRRQANLAGFLACVFADGFALFAQYVLGYVPCHLCIFQRVCVAILGVCFLLAAAHNPRELGAKVYAALIGLAAIGTAAVSGRHVYIQMLPAGSVPGCGADLNFMLEVMPLMDVLIKVFKAGGECQTIDLAPLGITMPAWVLAFAIVTLVGGVYANLKLRR